MPHPLCQAPGGEKGLSRGVAPGMGGVNDGGSQAAMERWRKREGKEEAGRQPMLKDSANALAETLIRRAAAQNRCRISAEMAQQPAFQAKRPWKVKS